MENKTKASLGDDRLRLSGEQLDATLIGCQERGAPVVITSSDMSFACRARFSELSKDRRIIGFEILDPVEANFNGYMSYGVTFVHAERNWLFIAQQRDFTPATPSCGPRLMLKRPPHLVGADLRRTLRVDISPSSDLEVRVTSQDLAGLVPTVVDVGLGGISLQFPDEKVPEIGPGTQLALKLQLGGLATTLHAEVRRRDGNTFGLSFTSVEGQESFEPPSPFREIVKTLEREWFAALGTQTNP